MSASALTFVDVFKAYGFRGKLALDGMSFTIPAGEIVGFVGPNGAGKTTTFSVVSGFLRPDKGEVNILGEGPFDAGRLKGRLGVLPQDAELPDRHTPMELLEHLGCLQGLSRGDARKEAERLVELVRLDDRKASRISTLSHGMRRRVAVASALCGSPALVLLDEPMAGLDPKQAYSLRDRLAELRGKQTVVVSSHNLDEVERLCDSVVMVQNGRCVREGSMAALTGASEISRWTLNGTAPMEALTARLPEATLRLDGDVLEVQVARGQDDAASQVVMAVLVESKVTLKGLVRGRGLERQFLDDQG